MSPRVRAALTVVLSLLVGVGSHASWDPGIVRADPTEPGQAAQEAAGIPIHSGFYTGSDFLSRTAAEQRTYAAGLVEGMMLPQLFGAPRRLAFKPKEMAATTPAEWLENCVQGMHNEQVGAILRKYFGDHRRTMAPLRSLMGPA